MASRTSTRRKIQALLSSFLHDKEESFNERKGSSHDVSENPGVLSTLCQPRNRESFYNRVETFSPYTWFMKPLYLSPQHCALYGWENTDVDLLTCVSCKATLDGTVGSDWDTHMYNSICIELKANVIDGHSKFCPWKDSPCPESFLSLPEKTILEWKQHFQLTCQDLLTFNDNLPVLKREAFQEMEVTEEVLSILSSNISEDNKESYHQDIVDTACVMALCGWNACDKDSPGILSCSACHREAGLWNFLSLKNPSNVDSGANEPSSGEHGTGGDTEFTQASERDGESAIPLERDVTLVNEATQRFPREIEEEEMTCEHVAAVDTQKEDLSTEGEIQCEDGLTEDNEQTQRKELGTEEEMSCEGDVVRGNEDTQRTGMVTEEEMVCDDGIAGDSEYTEEKQNETICETNNEESRESGMGTAGVGSCEDGTAKDHELERETEEPLPPDDAALELKNKDKERTEGGNDQSLAHDVKRNGNATESLSTSSDVQTQDEASKIIDEPFQEPNPEAKENCSSNQTIPSDASSSEDIKEISRPELFSQTASGFECEAETQKVSEVASKSEESLDGNPNPAVEQLRLAQGHPSDQTAHDINEETQCDGNRLQTDNEGATSAKESQNDILSGFLHETESHSELGSSVENVECFSETGTKKVSQQTETSDEMQVKSDMMSDEGEMNKIAGDNEKSKFSETHSENASQASSNPCLEGDSDASHSRNAAAYEPCRVSMGIEPSKLFGVMVSSPAHSRQDSLIVEVGDDSLRERLESIQSELQDAGEPFPTIEPRRSLSGESETDEPRTKRLKTQDIERTEFDVLAEHRNWCPWVTPVPSLNPKNAAGMVQKYPGWQILLQSLKQCSYSGKAGDKQQTPPSQVWKSVRRLFHDCQTTLSRGTGTKNHGLERKVS